MFDLAGLRRRSLSRSLGFEFRVDPCGSRAARRLACCTSASQDAGFRALLGLCAFHTAQALQVVRFFVLSGRCAGANCLRFAATRLKFAARLVDFTLSAAPHFGPFTLSSSIDVRFRGLDDRGRNGICAPQSTTTFTRSLTLTCACASSPFSTRNRSAGRSTPAMRCDSDSTVSPGCTVMTFMRNGRAA
jgi:hypothetical protein